MSEMSGAEHGRPRPAHLVEVHNLVHVYPGGTAALDDVSLSIGWHERLAIVGQNGSGKTTLVKHFNGLLRPTSGKVMVEGRDAALLKIGQLAARVGYVFQNPNHQLFCTTVREELCFGLKNLRLPAQQILAKSEEVIEFFGLQPYLDAHPYSLSMGVRKLVAIASIYAMGPQLMILDEPTTGQDHRSNLILSQAIDNMFAAGKTIVFVTHNMRFVAEQAERVVVMTKAKIIFDGRPGELFCRDDILRAANLRPPQITALARQLAPEGVKPDVLTVPAMAAALEERCRR